MASTASTALARWSRALIATIEGNAQLDALGQKVSSLVEAKVHPGLYRRREGVLDLSTLQGSGFGYRVKEIGRQLPAAAVHCGA